MFAMDGFVYRTCTWIYYFAYLNILFLLSCLPIVTIPPAVAALFGVTRKLVKGEDPSIFTAYRKLFVENLKQSYLTGLVMGMIGLFILEDFHLLSQMKISFHFVIFTSLCCLAIIYTVTLLYLFPLMVNGYYTTKQLFINSFKFGLYRFHMTLLNIIVLIGLLIVSLRFSFLFVFFYASVSAYITYWFANRKFAKIEQQMAVNE